jgi:hypothetical protein
VFFGVFTVLIPEVVDGIGVKGSGGTITFDVQTLLEAFFNMSLRSACFIDDGLSCKR